MNRTADWTDLARNGQTLEAIVAYRASVGVGLGEAKEVVERWVAANLPPSVGYQLAAKVGWRITNRLDAYLAETGRTVSYSVHVLAADGSEFVGHPALLHAVLPEGHDGRDLDVLVELPGTPGSLRQRIVAELLDCGTRMVWLVGTSFPAVHVCTGKDSHPVYFNGATFTGGDVLPGFSCKVADLFA